MSKYIFEANGGREEFTLPGRFTKQKVLEYLAPRFFFDKKKYRISIKYKSSYDSRTLRGWIDVDCWDIHTKDKYIARILQVPNE